MTKGPRAFLTLKRSSQVSKGYTNTEDAFRPARTHMSREILMTETVSSVGGGFPMRGPSRLMVHLLRLSEDSLKSISDI